MGPDLKPCPALLEWIALGFGLLSVLLGFFTALPMRLLDSGSPLPGSVFTGGGL